MSSAPAGEPPRGASRARTAAAAILVLAWSYSAIRAGFLSLTHDEALTYLLHVRAPWRDVLLHTQPIGSNNHLLNTAFIKLLVPLFGDSELVLRAPVLLGHALYLFAVQRILTALVSGPRLVLGAGLLGANPMLLDFFTLARGYGLGLGFSGVGLALALERVVRPERRTALTGSLCASAFVLSVLANVAFVNLALATAITLLGIELAARPRPWRRTVRTLVAPALPGLALLAAIYNPTVLERIRSNLTTWGGMQGFWVDTVGSLVEHMLYAKAPAGASIAIAQGSVLVALVIASTSTLVDWRRSGAGDGLVRTRLALASVVGLVVLGTQAQFALLGTLYPIDRGAIYLVPPFLLWLVTSWEALRRTPERGSRCLARFLAAFCAVWVVHGMRVANLTHTHLWRYDATTRDALARIRADIGATRLTRPYRVGASWRFRPALSYYLRRDPAPWIDPPDPRGPDGVFDYYYLHPEDHALVATRDLVVLETFRVSDGVLARRGP